MPSTEATVSASISWFFGEKASMVGGMIQIRCPSSPSQTNRWREKTSASAPFSSGRRKSQAPRTSSFGSSTPTWQRQTTDAPSSRTGLTIPAVCGSCRNTMSPRRTRWASSAVASAKVDW